MKIRCFDKLPIYNKNKNPGNNMKIYIAGPLFCKAELDYNEQLAKFLSGHGFDTFLPQRDGYQQTELEKAVGKTKSSEMIFEKDVQELKNSDVVVFNLDGRVPDEGACVEIGIGYALGKDCVGLKTDVRTAFDGIDNPMILGALRFRVVSSFGELKAVLDRLK
jgi:nucleoside 2-deoxyribosyltransferase